MIFKILVVQRKCNYLGQYAPEALAVMTGTEAEDNPKYLQEMETKARKSEEFAAVAVISVHVFTHEVDAILFPVEKSIHGEVLTDETE